MPGGVADARNFPSALFEKLEEPPYLQRETLPELYKFVYNLFPGVRTVHSDNALDL